MWCALAPPLSAQTDVASRVEAAFTQWATRAGAGSATLTLWKDGVALHDVALGGMDATTPVELASLSKAITATCAASLMAQGVWGVQTSVRDVLGYGPETLTLGALLTHSGGVMPDQTQGIAGYWWRATADNGEHASRRALTRAVQTGQAGTFAYNNENYAIIGSMIAAQTGTPYDQACRDRVLEPAGIDHATPSQKTGGFLPWGGWHMSVRDYAKFMHWAYGADGIIARDMMAWPAQQVRKSVYYGMGMFQRGSGPGYAFWHFGSWCYAFGLRTGSYAVHWQEGWSVVAAYDICTPDAQMGALDRAMRQAIYQ